MSVATSVVRKAMQYLPDGMNPLAVINELEPSSKAALFSFIRIAGELLNGADVIGPEIPPERLDGVFFIVELEYGVPAELLSAIAAEMSGYDLEYSAIERAGVMGFRRGFIEGNDPLEHARAAAKVIALHAKAHGLVDALLKYTGSREVAGRIVGSYALLLARKLDQGTRAAIADVPAILEELVR